MLEQRLLGLLRDVAEPGEKLDATLSRIIAERKEYDSLARRLLCHIAPHCRERDGGADKTLVRLLKERDTAIPLLRRLSNHFTGEATIVRRELVEEVDTFLKGVL